VANLTGEARARYVQEMFARIAPRYDLMNRLMTAGQDRRWRREVIRRAGLLPEQRLLDLGAGTGDLAFEALRQQPDSVPVLSDFSLEMMRVGQARENGAHMGWSGADALALPFADHTFDAVVSAFLLRNVSDIHSALEEQRRVLKPGGRLVALDTTRPPQSWLTPVMRFHLQVVIPTLGGLIARQPEAYHYLPDSTSNFLQAEELAANLVGAGFQQVGFRRLMLGAVAIHWGEK
jgi:demethylmenaquinone methyltransferase/2-methoxy-6-polyprenyl-1,4-benzoquinol methylase